LTDRQGILTLSGSIEQTSLCQKRLQQWLQGQGYHHLDPWLRHLSMTLDLPFSKITIRCQKTRWGSCSRRQKQASLCAISLNAKLLLLPAPLVRYVMIHELCHTVHMNHSCRFWDLVGLNEPNYRQLDRDLRTAKMGLPTWVEAERSPEDSHPSKGF
jgi:hypothetical protein